MVHCFHALNVGLQAEVFFDYARSKANIADLPSRGAIAEMLEILAAHFDATPSHVRAVMPLIDQWSQSPQEWMEKARRAVRRDRRKRREQEGRTRR